MYNGKKSTYISSTHSRSLPKKRRKSVFFPKIKRFIVTYKTILLIVVIFLLIVIIARLTYSFTIGKEANIIRTITFTDEDIQGYNNLDFYKYIRELLSGKNIIMTKISGLGNIENTIENRYPFVRSISLDKTAPSTVSVQIGFHKTDLVFHNSGVNIGYANKELFSLTTTDGINSGALVVQLPDYFRGESIETNATGYLYLMGPERLKDDFNAIQASFRIDSVLFLPGAQKSIVVAGNRKITFDHKRSITSQLQYLETIQSHHSEGYYEIDLTTFPKVIIKESTNSF